MVIFQPAMLVLLEGKDNVKASRSHLCFFQGHEGHSLLLAIRCAFLDYIDYMDVSENRGTQKWMVYIGKPY